MATSGLKKQTSAILEFFLPLLRRPYHSNRRAILHQTTTATDVIYNFKMAATVGQYYFRFRIWRCHSSEGQSLSANQISSTYVNARL